MPKPLEAFHPGEFFLEELDAREMACIEFARLSGLSEDYLRGLIVGRESVTEVFAEECRRIWGQNPKTWLRLQQSYDLYAAKS